jgi:hypothetical protein
VELNAWIAEQKRLGFVDELVDAYDQLSCGDSRRLCPDYEPPFNDGLHFGPRGHERLGEAMVATAFAECSAAGSPVRRANPAD